ncbi:MAG: flagellar protein FlaG [Candidatus Sedimenticola sp. (ex Thyasira tokunagai)]
MAVELINQANMLPANRANSSHPGQTANVSEVAKVETAKARSPVDQNEAQPPPAVNSGKGTDDAESLKKLVAEANALVQTTRRKVQFSVSEETGRPVIRVYDADSQKLIRQYPPDELIALVARIHEMVGKPGAGLILSDEA